MSGVGGWLQGAGFPVGANACLISRDTVGASFYFGRKVCACINYGSTGSCVLACECIVACALGVDFVLIRLPVRSLSLMIVIIEIRRAVALVVLVIHTCVDVAFVVTVFAYVTHLSCVAAIVTPSE